MSPRFLELFWRQALRPAWRRPGLSVLNAASIALGVAVFLAIQVANEGAVESFRSAVALTTGRAGLEVRGEIDEELFPMVAGTKGVRLAAPVVEGILPLVEPRGEYFRILGVDPFGSAELLAFELAKVGGESLDYELWLREPGVLATSPAQAERMKSWAAEGRVEVFSGDSRVQVWPAFALISDEPLARAEPRLAAMDISWAQEILSMQGRLTSIQLLLEEGANAVDVAERLRAALPSDLLVAPPASRNEEMQIMMAAFHLNLTAMSLVSVIVGMFLIYNSVGAAVVRRQHQIAVLRACGTTRMEIRCLFLGEAVAEAAVGSALGILVAPLLARMVAAPIAGTISALYELTSVNSLGLNAWQIAGGFGVGIFAAVIASWFPSSEAAGINPASILHPGASQRVFAPRIALRTGAAGFFLLMAFLAGVASLNGGHRLLGFASAGCVIAGFSFLTPWFAMAVGRIARPLGLTGRMAADHLDRSLHRNAMTIAALAAAVAMAVAVTVMIHSFRSSVQRWIERTLTADLYLAPAANEIGGLHAFLPPGAKEWVAARPEISMVSTFRELTVRYANESTSLAVIEGRARGNLEFLNGSAPDAAEQFEQGRAVALSESFVSRFGNPGRMIRLMTPHGEQEFPVAGIIRDYTRDGGSILIPRQLFAGAWDDARLHSLAVNLRDLESVESLTAAFRNHFGDAGQFAIYDNLALRERIFEIFEQTFAVTSALRVIAILVAAVGILFSLSILATERGREIGVLRAIGASRVQILGFFLGESALIGSAAALCGLASGAVLAMVLTWVVNKAFFGWSITLTYPLAALLPTPLWIVAASVFAAFYPAWAASRTPPAAAVRFE